MLKIARQKLAKLFNFERLNFSLSVVLICHKKTCLPGKTFALGLEEIGRIYSHLSFAIEIPFTYVLPIPGVIF